MFRIPPSCSCSGISRRTDRRRETDSAGNAQLQLLQRLAGSIPAGEFRIPIHRKNPDQPEECSKKPPDVRRFFALRGIMCMKYYFALIGIRPGVLRNQSQGWSTTLMASPDRVSWMPWLISSSGRMWVMNFSVGKTGEIASRKAALD